MKLLSVEPPSARLLSVKLPWGVWSLGTSAPCRSSLLAASHEPLVTSHCSPVHLTAYARPGIRARALAAHRREAAPAWDGSGRGAGRFSGAGWRAAAPDHRGGDAESPAQPRGGRNRSPEER